MLKDEKNKRIIGNKKNIYSTLTETINKNKDKMKFFYIY